MATARLIFANMIYSLHSMSKNVNIDHYFIYSASYTCTKYLYIKINDNFSGHLFLNATCTAGYPPTDRSRSETPEVIVAFGDAALDLKTWTGLVSRFLYKTPNLMSFMCIFGFIHVV